jgi:hypothetical protein
MKLFREYYTKKVSFLLQGFQHFFEHKKERYGTACLISPVPSDRAGKSLNFLSL